MQLLANLDMVATALSDSRGAPLAHAIHHKDSRFTKGAWIKRARGVADVVLAKVEIIKHFLLEGFYLGFGLVRVELTIDRD